MALQEVVAITYDPGKRGQALKEWDFDFTDAAEMFAGRTIDLEGRRRNYGEARIVSTGFLRGRMVFGRLDAARSGSTLVRMGKD